MTTACLQDKIRVVFTWNFGEGCSQLGVPPYIYIRHCTDYILAVSSSCRVGRHIPFPSLSRQRFVSPCPKLFYVSKSLPLHTSRSVAVGMQTDGPRPAPRRTFAFSIRFYYPFFHIIITRCPPGFGSYVTSCYCTDNIMLL